MKPALITPSGPVAEVSRRAAPAGADFAVTATDDTLAPYVRRGEIIFFTRDTDLRPGDVGLFSLRGRLILRQFADGIDGSAYLFALNRDMGELDEILPPDAREGAVCLGRVLLPCRPPLPGVAPETPA